MKNKDRILQLLDDKKNVLLMGAPGTGKSRLINEVAVEFEKNNSVIGKPVHNVGAAVPIPAQYNSGIQTSFLKKKNRKVFRTTLHQNSKYRDFLTGIIPTVGVANKFEISEGILYRANEFAKQDDSAALLIIDELNRGPAIEVFGGSIVAIESDKRLSDDNNILPTTQLFELINPSDGKSVEYAFSPNLYILAAMNQADVSVAPLDVAFLRRWQPYRLLPNYEVLKKEFSVKDNNVIDTPATVEDYYKVAILALEKINELITVGRGEDYQLGQGVFLSTGARDNSLEAVQDFVLEVWEMIYAHIEELFFGDTTAIAYIINAASSKSPYVIEEVEFAGERKTRISHKKINRDNIYDVYHAIIERS